MTMTEPPIDPRYMRDVARAGGSVRLTAAEEVELTERARSGDKAARERMIEVNLRLVISLAKGFVGRGLALDDLVEIGNLGLMNAVRLFDGSFGVRFSTFAARAIKNRLRREIAAQVGVCRVPDYLARLHWSVVNGDVKYESLPEPQQRYLRHAAASRAAPNPLGRFHAGDAGGSAPSHPDAYDVVDHRGPHAGAEVVRLAENAASVADLMRFLSPREQTVIARRFGLGGHDRETLKAIGEDLGLTREWIRQVEVKALAKLRLAADTRGITMEDVA